MTKSRIFFLLNIALVAGIAVASFLPASLTGVWAIFVVGVAIVASAIRRPGVSRTVMVAGICITIAAFGMFWFLWRSAADLPFESMVSESMTVEGLVAREPRQTENSQQVLIKESGGGTKILLVTRRFPEYSYGDRIAATGVLKHPENFSEDFDYAAFLAKDDIYYTMVFPAISVIGTGEGKPVQRVLFGIKNKFAASLEALFPEPHAAYMKGLLLGERQSFSDELREDLRRTGTAHIVALSGYNISIVASGLLAALRWFWVPFGAAFWGATAGIIGFVMLTGAQASVVRAAIMGVLVLVARREGRQYRMRNVLAFAAAVMLLENPKLLRFDVAFQLSFLATIGIVWGSPRVAAWLGRIGTRMHIWLREYGIVRDRRNVRQGDKRSLVRDTLSTTIAAQLAVSPLLVFTFGELSLISPIANIFILPFIPYTMGLGFFAGLIGMAAPFAALPIAWIARLLTGYELGVVGALAKLPYAATTDRRIGVFILSALVLGISAVVLWRRRKARIPATA